MKRDARSWDLEHDHLSSLGTSPFLLLVLLFLAAAAAVYHSTLLLQNVIHDYPNWFTVLKIVIGKKDGSSSNVVLLSPPHEARHQW